MKKLIACLILVIMLAVPLTSYADEAVTEAEKWDMSVPAELTENIQTLFDKAMENLVGVHYTPVAVLGARGNTYCILCKARVVYPGAEPYNVLVYINENGIQNIYELWIEKHAEKETPDAVSLLREAAEQGDADAQNELGKCYASGSGVEQSYEEAARYYRMAADQGFAKSQYNLATLYLYGLGVERDCNKANALLQLAAGQGLAHAQYLLGYNYEFGIGFEQDMEKAFQYYSLAAEQGLAEAQNDLGNCYMYGKGVAQDKARAVAYYRLAAEQGEPNAQNSLGCCFFDGNGVEQNYEEGMKYFLLSAQQGNPDAIYNLGYNYYYGEGVDRDYDKALEYFKTAAEMNHPSAFFLIGECCYEGNGVEKDVKIAKEWFRRALDAGYEPDEEDRALLEDVFGEGLSRQRIIEEMVVDYGSYGQAADEHVRTLLNNLRSADADAADRWDSIMTLWQTVNADLTIHENVLPDGLPNTDELCIVALGFQLNADGTMRDELIERLKVVLNSAEKYPNALIVCTGGGTAAENEASTEAGKMAEWLIANGIPEERIIIEDRSLTTAQNAIYTYDILTERYPQVSQLAIVSSDYHIATGTLLFEAEAILRAEKAGGESMQVVSNAAWKAPSGSLSTMFQAGALIELSGDVDTAFEIYYETYDIHELPQLS